MHNYSRKTRYEPILWDLMVAHTLPIRCCFFPSSSLPPIRFYFSMFHSDWAATNSFCCLCISLRCNRCEAHKTTNIQDAMAVDRSWFLPFSIRCLPSSQTQSTSKTHLRRDSVRFSASHWYSSYFHISLLINSNAIPSCRRCCRRRRGCNDVPKSICCLLNGRKSFIGLVPLNYAFKLSPTNQHLRLVVLQSILLDDNFVHSVFVRLLNINGDQESRKSSTRDLFRSSFSRSNHPLLPSHQISSFFVWFYPYRSLSVPLPSFYCSPPYMLDCCCIARIVRILFVYLCQTLFCFSFISIDFVLEFQLFLSFGIILRFFIWKWIK